jgi:hypothetical protein
MHRALYFAGLGYLAICGAVVLRPRTSSPPPRASHATTAIFQGSGQEWFTAIKPLCNTVEVAIAQRDRPAPATLDGQGFSAACYALAGKIAEARSVIGHLPPARRAYAAGIVFEVAHPVADAGDNRSAGPIMELVVEYWPNHYMALYHAGMAEYALGQYVLARTHLRSFLHYYDQNDGWTQSAQDALARLR